jgi:hypothetical protein
MKYILIKIIKSDNKNKKYDAIIKNIINGQLSTVSFGNINKKHYMDKTPLGLYKHLNHYDEQKRIDYITENKNKIKGIKNKFSPDYFTAKFLYCMDI